MSEVGQPVIRCKVWTCNIAIKLVAEVIHQFVLHVTERIALFIELFLELPFNWDVRQYSHSSLTHSKEGIQLRKVLSDNTTNCFGIPRDKSQTWTWPISWKTPCKSCQMSRVTRHTGWIFAQVTHKYFYIILQLRLHDGWAGNFGFKSHTRVMNWTFRFLFPCMQTNIERNQQTTPVVNFVLSKHFLSLLSADCNETFRAVTASR